MGKEKKRKEKEEGKKRVKKRKKRKEIRKRKRKGKKTRKNKKEMRESCAWRRGERKKKERHFPSQSSANRRLKRVGTRDKVGPRDESYVWVLETAGFVSFQKVEVSHTLVISCLVAM